MEVNEVLRDIEFMPGWKLRWVKFPGELARPTLYQVWWEFDRPDVVLWRDGKQHVERGRSGDLWFSVYDLHSEGLEEMVVRRVFGLALQTMEHEVREFFQYKGQAPFNPHRSLIGADVASA